MKALWRQTRFGLVTHRYWRMRFAQQAAKSGDRIASILTHAKKAKIVSA
jgi:hypothetical protein